jgi:hypothetical protein
METRAENDHTADSKCHERGKPEAERGLSDRGLSDEAERFSGGVFQYCIKK